MPVLASGNDFVPVGKILKLLARGLYGSRIHSTNVRANVCAYTFTCNDVADEDFAL